MTSDQLSFWLAAKAEVKVKRRTFQPSSRDKWNDEAVGLVMWCVCVCVMKRWWVCYLNKRAALWRCVWTVSPGWITFICPAPNHSLFTWSGPDEAAERKRGLVPAGQTEFLLHQSTGQTNMCCSSLLQQKWRAAPLFISRLYSYCSNNQIPANKVTDERTGSWEPLAYELLTANRC